MEGDIFENVDMNRDVLKTLVWKYFRKTFGRMKMFLKMFVSTKIFQETFLWTKICSKMFVQMKMFLKNVCAG